MTLEELQEMGAEINDLKNVVKSYRQTLDQNLRRIERLADVLVRMITDGDISQEAAEDIASHFDLDLTNEVEGTVTVTYSFTAKLGIGQTINDLDFWPGDLSERNCDDIDISYEDIEVTEN
jgi:DNA primase large subunit